MSRMEEKAEQIANELKEKAQRYELLTHLLKTAENVEMDWDELMSEFEDKHGWVSEQTYKMVSEIEAEMAEIERVLE